MNRTMRRSKQQLTHAQCEDILRRGTAGVLALCGGDTHPYAVPISYAYEEGILYFHSATEGHKLDLLRENPKASFCVIDQDRPVPEEFTTYFRSVIAFGTLRIIEDDDAFLRAVRLLSDRFWPDHESERETEIQKQRPHFLMLAFHIDHLTGKQAKELTRGWGQA